jgi:hypothetical protein
MIDNDLRLRRLRQERPIARLPWCCSTSSCAALTPTGV